MTWIDVRDDEIEALRETAERPIEEAGVVRNLLERINEAEADRKAYAREIAKADDLYGRDGEIEIDSNAPVSPGDDPGVYVGAWVWVDMPRKKPKKKGATS